MIECRDLWATTTAALLSIYSSVMTSLYSLEVIFDPSDIKGSLELCYVMSIIIPPIFSLCPADFCITSDCMERIYVLEHTYSLLVELPYVLRVASFCLASILLSLRKYDQSRTRPLASISRPSLPLSDNLLSLLYT